MGSPPPPVAKFGLGLIITNEFNPNVFESFSLPPLNTKPMSLSPTSPPKKKDPSEIGFIDDMGGGVDGLMLCTESLGFESCNERRVDDDDERNGYKYMEFCEEERRDKWRIRKTSEERRSEEKNKKFPAPLSSLNQNGQPCFYLKPVRKKGRLELTEVKIQRPEILRAIRENGRLRLHLVNSDVCSKINEEEEQEENEEKKREVQEQEVHNFQEEEMKVEELWNYRVSGESCLEMVMSRLHHDYHQHHHINDHHSFHVWRQPCVSIR